MPASMAWAGRSLGEICRQMTDPARNGPYGTQSRVLRHSSSRVDHSRRVETEEGLMRITTDEVVDSAEESTEDADESTEDDAKS